MIDPALLSGIIKLTILLLIQYASGCLVFYKGVKVNYTRKINHFALFFIPLFIDNILPVQPSIELMIIGGFVAVVGLIIYIKPIRSNSRLIQRMFLSFDRPEDRPNTLLWLSTQITVGYLILLPIIIYFYSIGYGNLILIPILVIILQYQTGVLLLIHIFLAKIIYILLHYQVVLLVLILLIMHMILVNITQILKVLH